MGLTACADCGTQVSTEAAACPRCGRRRKRAVPWPRVVLALVVLGAAAWVAKVTLEYEAAKSDAAGQFGGRR